MKTTAGKALIDVLASWGIGHLYGIPGSSVNGLMEALAQKKDSVAYIQVRHESAGAMAAAGHAKATGQIGACFGSAAPGGTNLFNGLYDAKMDRVPLLALVGQTATVNMGTTFFQEMDEVPLYADVSVYNHMAATAAQIPDLVEEAIRTAYARRGVAVVILPNDLVEEEIDYTPRREQKAPPAPAKPPVREAEVAQVLALLQKAERPVLYAGLGLRGAGKTVAALSERFSMPVVTSVPAIGAAMPAEHENFMGSFGRLGTKPAYEVLNAADLVLFAGSSFPFARYWPKSLRVVQINNEVADIGRQVPVEMGIVADGEEFLARLLSAGEGRSEGAFLQAARKAKRNWDAWLDAVASDEARGLAPEAVIRAIRDHAAQDAFFGLDVGNNTMQAIRMLPQKPGQQHVLSGWFATLGVSLPYAMAAKLHQPARQVWSISGDGGFAMNMQEILTQARYGLPIINVVLDNRSYGFIEHAQLLAGFDYGVDLPEADWATAARGMGAVAFTARSLSELDAAMREIGALQAAGNTKPILLDAKTYYADPMDTSHVVLDPERYSQQEIDTYRKQYNVFGQPPLSELMREMG